MAQLHINATVTKDSPVVYLPGDQRAELKIGDYFKLVGIAGVYEIGAISLIGTDTQIQLTAPFLGESGNYPALIHRDFSPEQGYPLIYAGDLDIPDLLRRWALQADSAPAAAVAAHEAKGPLAHALATPSAHGFLDKADKIKLDALKSAAYENVGTDPLDLPRNLRFGTAAFVDWDQLVTRGSNANGGWVRFSDGTQICYGRINIESLSLNVALGSFFRNLSAASITMLPREFIDTNYTVFVQATTLVAEDPNHLGVIQTFIFSPSEFRFYVLSASNQTIPFYGNFLAIGRWK